MRSDLADANSQLMKIKEAERRKEIEEVKKIEAFAQKRETLENMKKEREEKRMREMKEAEEQERVRQGRAEVVRREVEAVSYTHLTLPTNREV